MTTGGPDSGSFCVFPFIWKSKVYRSCALVSKAFTVNTISCSDHGSMIHPRSDLNWELIHLTIRHQKLHLKSNPHMTKLEIRDTILSKSIRKIVTACWFKKLNSCHTIEKLRSIAFQKLPLKTAFLIITILDHLTSELAGVQNFKGTRLWPDVEIEKFHMCSRNFGTQASFK